MRQRGAFDAHDADDEEFGRFAQACQRPYATGGETSKSGFDAPTRGLAQPLHQTVDGLFSSKCASLENHIRGLLRIVDAQIALQRLHDRCGILSPTRAAKVDFSETAHTVAIKKVRQRFLSQRRQRPGQITSRQDIGLLLLKKPQGVGVCADRFGRIPQRQIHLGGDVVRDAAGDLQGQLLAFGHGAGKMHQGVEHGHAGGNARQEGGEEVRGRGQQVVMYRLSSLR